VFLRSRSIWIALLQLLLIVASAALAWLLRFDFAFPHPGLFLSALPLLALARLGALARFNLFHGYWRYTGISDAMDIAKAVSAGSLVFLVAERWIVSRWIAGANSIPISFYVIEGILSGVALGGTRMLSRAFMQKVQQQAGQATNKAVVVIGAGAGAALLLQELAHSGYTPYALVDDDPAKKGVKLRGVPVAGGVDDLGQIVRRYHPSELMIAIPSATRTEMRRITESCQGTGLRFRTIPGLADLLDGKVSVGQLREVNPEDLLGRQPVKLNLESVRHRISGRNVMVTGAAGSIGAELCNQLLRYGPSRLVCVDQAETPLFYLQLAHRQSQVETAYCVADITDHSRMRGLIEAHDVRVIFHAAAYKHVPLMEENLEEAVKNNVFGLLGLMEIADASGCEDFLLISSDKAVGPTSFMGCTKRIGELIVAARPASGMRSLCVRFGNVLGSQGSVIPLFQQQIKMNHRITVTHPEITRYFMTIPEAVSLVLEAFSIGGQGDILVLDMGEPVRILDLAKTLIRLSGIPQDQVRIVYTGLRPGEKLFEELFYKFEQRMSTSTERVLRAKSPVTSWTELQDQLKALRAECATSDPVRIRLRVKEIVPQYQWSTSWDDRGIPASAVKEPLVAPVSVALPNAGN
jgi:FlaA1/EpsC-like NDP-sugar epimerase